MTTMSGLEVFLMRISGVSRCLNRDYVPNNYLDEVRDDITLLKEGLKESRFERDGNEIFQFVARRYREKYCPCTYYKLFSFENQLAYLYLRTEIDDLLKLDEQDALFRT